MFDVSARPFIHGDILSFSVPMNRFVEMVGNMEESFFITQSWRKINKRIKKEVDCQAFNANFSRSSRLIGAGLFAATCKYHLTKCYRIHKLIGFFKYYFSGIRQWKKLLQKLVR